VPGQQRFQVPANFLQQLDKPLVVGFLELGAVTLAQRNRAAAAPYRRSTAAPPLARRRRLSCYSSETFLRICSAASCADMPGVGRRMLAIYFPAFCVVVLVSAAGLAGRHGFAP